MSHQSTPQRHWTRVWFVYLCILAGILTACTSPADTPTTTPLTDPPPATRTATVSPEPTPMPIPTTTDGRTPPTLPDIYISEHLNPLDTPHTYIKNTCRYLRNRWDENNAAPGTVVMIVMVNNINRGSTPNSSDSITVGQFERMIENVQEQGFEAINTIQLTDFLERNKYIPPRSVLFVQDGRRTADNFERHFRPYWQTREWPVVNAWIIQADTPVNVWQENLALEQEGFVDHQLYSSLHRFSDNASEEYLSFELQKYVDLFEQRYEKTPIAIVWPGEPGENFTKAARQLEFHLGFTANARGPVMYNWIPLADHPDPSRPAYYPEGRYEDPLMTLPRYWPYQVLDVLDQVRLTGREAAAYAAEHKEVELEYYDIVCAEEFGEIPGIP